MAQDLPVYDEAKRDVIALRKSPAMGYNNLTVGGGSLAYAHQTEVCLLPEPNGVAAAMAVDKFPFEESSTVIQVAACQLEGKSYLVICTTRDAQVWNFATRTCLMSEKLPEHNPESASTAHFTRGVAAVTNEKGNFICVGTSTALVNIYDVKGNGAVLKDCSLEAHEAAITDMASDVVNPGTFVSADQNGKIVVWASPAFEKESVFAADGIPCTGVRIKDALVVAALATGTIRVLNCKTGVKVAELGGHSRIITALDMHPSKDIFVTVGEDTFVNVWTLPTEGKESSLVLNAQVENAFLTGVKFCGPDQTSVAVAAYDMEKLTVFHAI